MPNKKRTIFDPVKVMAKRKRVLRAEQSEEEKSQEREANRIQHALRRKNEITEDRESRLQNKRERQGTLRATNWLYLQNEAYNYNYKQGYLNFPQINSGNMSVKCNFCHALKFEGETSGLCCSSGNVYLPELPELPATKKSNEWRSSKVERIPWPDQKIQL